MSLPHKLASLTEREAVTDALYRIMKGFDSNDISIFNSALSPDITFSLSGTNRVINGLEALRTQLFDSVGPMDTLHMVSNVRVDLKDGSSNASLTAYGMVQHCPPGRGAEADGPKYLTGSMYALELVKDASSGLWKIRKFDLNIIWKQGDHSVMKSVV